MVKNILSGALFFAAAVSGAAHGDVRGVTPDSAVDSSIGIRLPAGFQATVFADEVGFVRHIVAGKDGWLYGALAREKDGYGAVALRDTDEDGKADDIRYFGSGIKGTGIDIRGQYLYYGEDTRIVRFSLSDGPVPTGDGEVIVDGFLKQGGHASKPFTFDRDGNINVNIGAPSNACMEKPRTKGSPGAMPCAQLDLQSGVWRFSADKTGQTLQNDGHRYATGIRNAMALDWNPHADSLYVAQHGRDQLASFFPDLYTDADSAELPAEEFHRVQDGDDLGWPFSYYDHIKGERIVMPEYGGDGKTVSRTGKKPLVGFPGHWAPNDLLFRHTTNWPAGYAHGAFIAFHGSWNRAPMPQQGYRVAYVPMDADGTVTGDWITFADGMAGTSGENSVKSPRDAKHRPMGLAEGKDGALYISSLMSGGRIWKITHESQ